MISLNIKCAAFQAKRLFEKQFVDILKLSVGRLESEAAIIMYAIQTHMIRARNSNQQQHYLTLHFFRRRFPKNCTFRHLSTILVSS